MPRGFAQYATAGRFNFNLTMSWLQIYWHEGSEMSTQPLSEVPTLVNGLDAKS
jgi:hypothetical protein